LCSNPKAPSGAVSQFLMDIQLGADGHHRQGDILAFRDSVRHKNGHARILARTFPSSCEHDMLDAPLFTASTGAKYKKHYASLGVHPKPTAFCCRHRVIDPCKAFAQHTRSVTQITTIHGNSSSSCSKQCPPPHNVSLPHCVHVCIPHCVAGNLSRGQQRASAAFPS